MTMDAITADTEAGEGELTFEAELEHPPEQVWRALTKPALLDAWLPEGPAVSRELLEADPPHSVRYAWRDGRGDPPLESEVIFRVDAAPGGTRLTVIHGGLTTARPANDLAPAWSLKCAA